MSNRLVQGIPSRTLCLMICRNCHRLHWPIIRSSPNCSTRGLRCMKTLTKPLPLLVSGPCLLYHRWHSIIRGKFPLEHWSHGPLSGLAATGPCLRPLQAHRTRLILTESYMPIAPVKAGDSAACPMQPLCPFHLRPMEPLPSDWLCAFPGGSKFPLSLSIALHTESPRWLWVHGGNFTKVVL